MSDGLLWLLLSGILFPFILLFFVSSLVSDIGAQARILSGAITASVILNSIYLFGQSFASQRARGEYELYATLPISKLIFISGTLGTSLSLNLLSALLLFIIAILVFGFKIKITLWLIPILILGSLSVAGIGLLVGILSRGPGEAALITNILVYVLSYATPIFYPIHNLPLFLQYVVLTLPTTHASALLTNILNGTSISPISVLVLVVWAVALLSLTVYKLDWRLRQ
ncbi:MAG: ABC transporter permease [Thermaceae bacterium]|nr:ABC transporter permease [Thermaceae bacterium]